MIVPSHSGKLENSSDALLSPLSKGEGKEITKNENSRVLQFTELKYPTYDEINIDDQLKCDISYDILIIFKIINNHFLCFLNYIFFIFNF